jgi:multidrug efflux pump subunit AcrA (membrane-fusion protein)
MAFAFILAAVGVIAAIFTVNSVTAGAQTYSAVVTTSKVYDLNFPNTGQVTSIQVKVGSHVTRGDLLATQRTAALQSQLAAAQGVVNADQAALAQAQAPQVSSAQKEQDALQVQQAQTALTNAQAALTSAEAAGKAAVAGAQAAVTSAQQLATSDQTVYTTACPKGPVPPSGSLTGAELQTAESSYQHCQDLQLQVDKDVSALNQAQAQVPVVSAQSEGSINQAQATVNSAQATLNLAEYQQTLQASSNNPAAVDQAQANLSAAQGQLTVARQALAQTQLIAPDDGVVAEVYGAVGEYLGPDGVHQYQSPTALPASQGAGFQLFPTQTVPSGGAGASSQGSEPMIEIIGGQQQIMAQVPESKVSGLPVGKTVHVNIAALGVTTDGVVTAVVLNPTHANSSVDYDVLIGLSHTVGGLLPGMSATVGT